ncbi:hypothetical protein EMCG_06937 [[Emmonsia] crescens]|uniref:Transcriptional activator of proteases prtT n=1 Tax=[Emmonsia] crescens TaxID=73230 RepID=A0A0G2J691_9EURO|nr:hypothetical protein EMCG_06937 [Emmonsia crescens UAMH 3008]
MGPSTSRRYACDRCRAHKLRCNRDLMASTDGPCLRCRKARVECSIGSAIRVGSTAELLLGFPAEMDAVNSTQNGDNGNSLSDPQNQSSTILDQMWRNSSPKDSNPSDDSPQLISIRWPNLSQPGFFQGEENFGEFMVTDAMHLPDTPLNFQDVGSSYRNDSTSNDFDVLQSTHFGSQPSHDVSVGQTQNNSEHSMLQHSLDSQQDASPRELQSSSILHNTSGTSSTDLPTAGSSDGECLSHIGLKDACIQQLSDLSVTLMKNLHRVEVLKRACSFLFDSPDKVTTEYLYATLEKSVIEDDSIGNMLRGSEQFLGIIRLCQRTAVASMDPSPNTASEGNSPHYSDPGGLEVSPEERLSERWKVLQSGFSRSKAPPTSPLKTPASSSNDLPPSVLKLDAHTTLTILACYTTLLKIHKTLFSILDDSFNYSCAFAEILGLPRMVTALQINGFMVGDSGCLHIRILLQTSRHLLSCIQKALDGILADTLAQSLLEVLLKQEGVDSLEDNEFGMKPVRDLLTIVEKKL